MALLKPPDFPPMASLPPAACATVDGLAGRLGRIGKELTADQAAIDDRLGQPLAWPIAVTSEWDADVNRYGHWPAGSVPALLDHCQKASEQAMVAELRPTTAARLHRIMAFSVCAAAAGELVRAEGHFCVPAWLRAHGDFYLSLMRRFCSEDEFDELKRRLGGPTGLEALLSGQVGVIVVATGPG